MGVMRKCQVEGVAKAYQGKVSKGSEEGADGRKWREGVVGEWVRGSSKTLS